MDGEIFYGASYQGSRKFSQHNIKTADATGFGAAADDYMERGIDLNEQLIRNKPATFFMRVKGEAMMGAGIFDGDVVIVDRSIKAVSGKIIIAVLNGEMIMRRLEKNNLNKVRLIPENNKLMPIDIDPSCNEFSIWGVVTYAIHSV